MTGFCAHYYEKLNYTNFLINLDRLHNCKLLGNTHNGNGFLYRNVYEYARCVYYMCTGDVFACVRVLLRYLSAVPFINIKYAKAE